MRGLVEYSSSSSDGEGGGGDNEPGPTSTTPAAPPPRLPPPRVRTFPHAAGQFAVHTHVPAVPPPAIADALRALVAQLAPAVPGLTPVDALAPGAAPADAAPLHVSLSRTAPLAGRDVPALTDGLAGTLTGAEPALPPGGFDLLLTSLAALANDEGTACFLTLAGGPPSPAFLAAVAAVDDAGALVGLPPFYPDPAPHVSFAWAPGGSAAALADAVAGMEDAAIPAWTLPITRIVCRVGKRGVVVWRARGGGRD